jgi:carboxyl-terminal processing protease
MKRLRLVRSACALLVGAILSSSIFGSGSTAFGQAPSAGPAFSAPRTVPAAQSPVVQPPVRIPSAAAPSLGLQGISGSPAAQNSAIASALEKGQDLESQRRWGEAFALYEDTVRQNYGQSQPELEQRLDIAKMHFDIGRRYADGSFRRSAVTLNDTDALAMFTDAANKLQAHYVQNPDWAGLVNRGTADLEIAISEQPFQENNLGQVNADRAAQFLRDLRKQQSQHPVRSLNDARNAVWNAGQMAQVYLGLRPAATMLEFTAAMLGGLDEYSAFLTGGQLNDLYSQIEGNFVGLGVELKSSDGALLIVNVIHNSPAERGGIKPGDKITSVGGRSTADVNTDKAAEMLQGPEGSAAQLTVVTGDEAPRQLSIRREHVDVSSVDDVKIIDRDFGIGYFKLTCFQKTTSQDVDRALRELRTDGMRSLVIDLRGNPGGLLTAAVEVAEKFVDSGTIVSTRGRSPGEDYNYQAHGTGQWRMPLVVLIDGDSASAAEILAGALRDYHRAQIVGTRSYGKGSVQGIFPLSLGGAGVRLTTAKFYSPLGKPFTHVGVDPDPDYKVQTVAKPSDGRIALPVSTSTTDDAIFNAGLQAARRLVAQR